MHGVEELGEGVVGAAEGGEVHGPDGVEGGGGGDGLEEEGHGGRVWMDSGMVWVGNGRGFVVSLRRGWSGWE